MRAAPEKHVATLLFFLEHDDPEGFAAHAVSLWRHLGLEATLAITAAAIGRYSAAAEAADRGGMLIT